MIRDLEHSGALRSLHICNLANVAYGYCKILRQEDCIADLRCHHLLHVASQPEWDDLELCGEDFRDEYNFFNNTAKIENYRRPQWYLSSDLFPSMEKREMEVESGKGASSHAVANRPGGAFRRAIGNGFTGLRNLVPDMLKPYVIPVWNRTFWWLYGVRIRTAWWLRELGQSPQMIGRGIGNSVQRVRKLIPEPMKRILRPSWRFLGFFYAAYRSEESTRKLFAEWRSTGSARCDDLISDSIGYGPEWRVHTRMLAAYRPHALWLSRHFQHDVAMCYVMSPIYAMLMGNQPYVSIEIGTMRDIPFDGSNDGKLLALAYRRSHYVLITNPDVRNRAVELGLERYSFCPHPLDEDVHCPDEINGSFRSELLMRHSADYILFAPARQNWQLKGNDRYLIAYSRLLRTGLRAVLIIPGWGQEVQRSRRLCRELGIEKSVRWIPPQSEPVLIKYYRVADIVLDQFILGTFGLITPKAMACGAVVLTSYDRSLHSWCFPKDPPVVRCSAVEEIYEAMSFTLADAERRRALGAAARAWVITYHSKRVIRGTLVDAMMRARETFSREQGEAWRRAEFVGR